MTDHGSHLDMAWADILGQDLTTRIWQTHLATGRVASAYLLVGPDGVGKRRLAIEFAKALNCLAEGPRPCDACPTCRQIAQQAHPDVHLVLPSGASDQIKIEDIRQLIARLALRPFSARLQVAVIDGVERFTEEAANSLLKVLEEPPAHSRFILLTSQLSHCLPTITSRCQRMPCQPLSAEMIRRILIQRAGCEDALAQAVARVACGSMAVALNVVAHWEELERLRGRFADTRPGAWLTQPLPETREEVISLLDGMMSWLRDLSIVATHSAADLANLSQREAVQRQAHVIDVDQCVETALELTGLRESVEQFVSPRLVATLAREKWLSLLSP